MAGKKVWITGSSGYLGTTLCRELQHVGWCSTVLGQDVAEPLYRYDKVTFVQRDVNDSGLVDWVARERPDVLVHLAFIVDPMRDAARQRRINVDGTRNVLAAAGRAGVPQLLVASSGSAYGAFADNPVPLTEEHPLRMHPSFQYAREKFELEALCREHEARYPDVSLAIIRPCVVYGPLVSNYLSDLATGLPVFPGLAAWNPPLQFVHEDDVAGAILAILESEAAGPFNITAPDTLRVREMVAMTGKPAIYLPDRVAEAVMGLGWRLGVGPLSIPPSFLDYMRYPWVMDSSRLTRETGYAFRYSSRDTFRIMLRAKGVIR